MSDTADLPEIEVHPPPAELVDPLQDPPSTTDQPAAQSDPTVAEHVPETFAEDVGDVGDVELGDAGLDLNLAAALSSLPPPEEDEQHELEHERQVSQFDPDMLANLAALSRIDDDEENDGAGADLEGQDFADLIGQATLTNEQVQEFVDTYGQIEGESEVEHDEAEAESSAAPTPARQPQAQSIQHDELNRFDRERHEREGSDEIQELSETERRDHNNLYYSENGKLKRRRNRTVL